MSNSLEKHSMTINGHQTSITLEPAFWTYLKKIAEAEKTSVGALVNHLDAQAPNNLSSAIRVFVLEYYAQRKP